MCGDGGVRGVEGTRYVPVVEAGVSEEGEEVGEEAAGGGEVECEEARVEEFAGDILDHSK